MAVELPKARIGNVLYVTKVRQVRGPEAPVASLAEGKGRRTDRRDAGSRKCVLSNRQQNASVPKPINLSFGY